MSVEEYRPIAITSSPAKVFESIIHGYAYNQVEKHLCEEQHGFRAKRSVNTNLLTMTEYISACLDRRRQVDVLYFDFKKAFDRVNNDILLAKICHIGFAPRLLHLLADYLRDRQQFVKLGLYKSHTYHTRSGVSQGSILGPLMFLLMVNDIPTVLKHGKCLLYADDLKLYSEINSEADCRDLQCDIDALCEWSRVNKLDFNCSKCYVMSFGRMQRPIIFDYKLNGSTITRTTAMRDLGVTFDPGLTFHAHISVIAEESYRRLGFVLRNAKEFRDHSVIKRLFNTLVRSKLEASSCVWNPHESTYSLILEKIQKVFLRHLYRRTCGYYPFMYPTNYLLGYLGYNSLEVRRMLDQIIVVLKVLHGKINSPLLLEQLSRILIPDNRNRRIRRHKLFAVPAVRTVARAHSPIPRALAAINAVLRYKPDLDVFVDEWTVIVRACLEFCEKSV